jgi:NAD(P)-dependent dehydrogenase (short-subunit alcohol dehydrogenase family)
MKQLVAISGGLGDIGRAIGEAFSARGDEVAVCDLAENAPEGFPAHYTQADVRSENSVRAWFDAMETELGRPPTLTVVNAGIHCNNGKGSSLETGVDDWTRTIEVNLTGAWLTAREAARRLLAVGRTGGITFVGSWVGQYPTANLAAYCASKAGMHSLVKTMALELGGQGIRVNEIAPGYVDAGLTGKIFEENGGLAERARQAAPSRQLIMPEEVARGVVFLTDPDNPNLTGTTLVLDGGISNMHGPQNLQSP